MQVESSDAQSCGAVLDDALIIYPRKFDNLCEKTNELSMDWKADELKADFERKVESVIEAAKAKFLANLKVKLSLRISETIDKAVNEENLLIETHSWNVLRKRLCSEVDELVIEFTRALTSLNQDSSETAAVFKTYIREHTFKSLKNILSTKRLRSIARDRYRNKIFYLPHNVVLNAHFAMTKISDLASGQIFHRWIEITMMLSRRYICSCHIAIY